MKSFLSYIFLLFLTIFLVILVDLNSSEIELWLQGNLGENYLQYCILFFLLMALLIGAFIFLKRKKSTKRKNQSTDNIQIKWEAQYSFHLDKAKKLISKARQKEALTELSKIKSEWLEEKITTLSTRLAEHKKATIRHIESDEVKGLNINRINHSIISLITQIKEYQEQEETYIKEVKQFLSKRYNNRLNQKLAGRQPIPSRLRSSTLGTSKNTHTAFVTHEKAEINFNIEHLFEEAHGRILILGNDGAGKSTLLLQLVNKLLESEKFSFPIILNIGTWQSHFQTLENWLTEILPLEMGTDQATAQKITEQYPLILLLDGFDEIPENDRPSFWQALGKFSANPAHQFVITSQIEAYQNATHDAPVNAQIEIGALAFEQIEKELKNTGFNQPEAQPLLQAIREDKILQNVVQNPFYFNALQLLFANGKRLRDLQFHSTDNAQRQNEIKEQLVEMLLFNIPKTEFKKEQVTAWLSFFAFEMKRHHLTTFELSDLQYTWSTWTKKELGEAKKLNDLINDIPQRIKNGGSLLFFPNFFISLFTFILEIAGILTGFTVKETEEIYRIITKDKSDWNAASFFNNSLKEWKIALLPTLFLGGIFMFAFGWIIGLLVGFIIFILLIAFHGAIETLSENHSNFLQINQPYQRFVGSAKALHFSIFQHQLLRYRLSQKKLLPLQLDIFLKKMTAYHLLESDGATWQFRHKILRDYFAEKYKVS